ncbi:DUF2399 domain-containing protein [Streptomyces radicis]|uniref:DUF2399 domain-containing protein n=1 Tax=Streptomyces radicis TaxID=1750517 RepID=UPI001E38133E
MTPTGPVTPPPGHAFGRGQRSCRVRRPGALLQGHEKVTGWRCAGWRYTAAAYRTVASTASLAPPLTGAPTAAPWDPGLRAAITHLGVRVEVGGPRSAAG